MDLDRLWLRSHTIRDHRRAGFYMPILRHLALRGHPEAMLDLSANLPGGGRRSDGFSQVGLACRAYRHGVASGAQHLAMQAFNRRDLAGYRYWLARAARLGDQDARRELRRFETRLPHALAFAIRRGRPSRAAD